MVNDFGAWVRGLREADGLTQVELAARMNVAQTIVSRVEAGKLEPTERVCVAFARAMDMPTEMVLRRAGYVSDYAVDAVPEDEAVDEFRWRLARVKNSDARALALDTIWSVLESAKSRPDGGSSLTCQVLLTPGWHGLIPEVTRATRPLTPFARLSGHCQVYSRCGNCLQTLGARTTIATENRRATGGA